jgi:hypothetical protein
VTEEKVPRSEHVIIPAENINSRCTSCGGTILTGGADTEQQNREYAEEELGDQQFPEQRGKIWIQNKLE